MLYNPARTGAGGEAGLSLGFRQQWVGFEDAPQFGQLHAHFSPDKDEVFGLGILFNHQNVFLLNRNDISLLGAVHILTELPHQLSLGLSFGLNQFGFSPEGLSQYNDPLIAGENTNIQLDGGLGLSYSYTSTSAAFHVDAAVGQLPSILGGGTDNTLYNFNTYTQLTLATRLAFSLSSQIQLEPGLMYRGILGNYLLDANNEGSVSLGGGDLDAQLRLLFNNYDFWVGLGLRTSVNTPEEISQAGFAGVNGSFGLELNDKFAISGVYDYNEYLGSSLEIGLSYTFQTAEKKGGKDSFDKVIRTIKKNAERANLFPEVQAEGIYFGAGNTAKFNYSYNDGSDEYRTASTPKLEDALTHMEGMIYNIRQTGAYVDSLHFIGQLRESSRELAKMTRQIYEGDSLQITYVLNGKHMERTIGPGTLDLEALILYKLYLIRQKLNTKPELRAISLNDSAMRLIIRTDQSIIAPRRNMIEVFLRKNN